jgi:hypothetical protein
MPTSSSQGTFTVPEPTDPPDVPYWIKELADDVDEKALMHTAGVRRRIHFQTYAGGTTNSSGYVNVNHTAGFTPRAALIVPMAPGTSFANPWGVDVLTSTSCRVRFGSHDVNGPLNTLPTGAFALLFIE